MIVKSGYGLKLISSGEVLGVSTQHTDADCSTDTIHTLCTCSDVPWMVKDKLNASYVRKWSTEWYNADYDTPVNPFKPEELSVVKLELSVTDEEPDSIPTFEEYMNMRYNTPGVNYYDPNHYATVMSDCKRRGQEGKYSLYDLLIYLDDVNKSKKR